MSYFEKNIRSLNLRFPIAAARVRVAAGLAEVRAGTRDSDNFGSQNPVGLLDRWLSGLTIQPSALLALSGFGDGSPLRRLLEKIPPGSDTIIWVFEPDIVRWVSVLHARDLTDLFADSRVLIGVGEPDERCFAALDSVDVLTFKAVEPVIFSPFYQRDEDKYAKAFTEFARQFDMRRKLWGTRMLDSALWQGNTIKNLARLTEAPDVGVCRNLFDGLPMVLVSAGPSLDESIPFLKTVQDRALIVAVNSSCRALVNGGVMPHLTLAADPREFTSMGFDGVSVDGIHLVAPYIVNPGVVERFRGRIFTWSGSNELVTMIRRRCGLKPGTTVVEQGTVSACALDLAILFGCRKLCLVGQDLAVRPDGQSHVLDSFYSDLDQNRIDPEKCRKMPGNTCDEVYVEERFYVYLKTFELLVSQRPGLSIINTSRFGAQIKGVPYADFEKARDWLGGRSGHDIRSRLQDAVNSNRGECLGFERLRQSLLGTYDFAGLVLQSALKVLVQGEVSSSPDSDAVNAEVLRTIKEKFESDPENFAILEDGRTRLELFRARSAVARMAADSEIDVEAAADREKLWGLAEGAFFLKNRLDLIFRKK